MHKLIDHIQLATMQKEKLIDDRKAEIFRLKIDIDKYKRSLDQSEEKVEGLNKQLTSMQGKMYSDVITILGIFTAITFATFGGLQLLGNVFGKIKHLSHQDVGSELMLGAVFLFGTYMILIALLTGISKLTNKSYKTSFPTRFLMIFSFSVIFIIGMVYANPSVWSIIMRNVWLIAILLCAAIIVDVVYEKKDTIKVPHINILCSNRKDKNDS
ncbi:hypothetical protein [Companilactobacillus insicii]|uniref:hypothetical protein n=1 Tax=Companilactobacillus insicii TaxID=1732567 RepID=UPI000F7B94E5|nr:hypothetical protein [Companilactobacillus insicii]